MNIFENLSRLTQALEPIANYDAARRNESNMYKIAQNPEFAQALTGQQNSGNYNALAKMQQIKFGQDQQRQSALAKLGDYIGTPGYNPQAALGKYAGITGDFDPVFGGSSATPAAIQEYQFLQNLTPEQKKEWFANKRGAQLVNQGGYTGVFDPLTGGFSNTIDKTISPDADPDLKRRQAAAVGDGKLQSANTGAINNATGSLAAFDELEAASEDAPSGKLENIGAGIANTYPSLSTEGTRKAATNQGAFAVKRAAAENDVRAAFRVAGSGAQTDADAKPIIDLLPNANDSKEVKIAKIKAAKESLITRVNAKAKVNGVPLPFSAGGQDVLSFPMLSQDQLGGGYEQAPALPPRLSTTPDYNLDAQPQTRVINGRTFVNQGGQWFAQ